jgi:hypothetical protein
MRSIDGLDLRNLPTAPNRVRCSMYCSSLSTRRFLWTQLGPRFNRKSVSSDMEERASRELQQTTWKKVSVSYSSLWTNTKYPPMLFAKAPTQISRKPTIGKTPAQAERVPIYCLPNNQHSSIQKVPSRAPRPRRTNVGRACHSAVPWIGLPRDSATEYEA